VAARGDVTTLLVGFPAGGPIDGIARVLVDPFREALGREVIVENRPGASGRIAISALLRAPPDGHTMLLTPGAMITLHPHLYPDLPYDPITQLIPISLVGTSDLAIVVGPNQPSRNVIELMRWFNEHPKEASCGTSGAGTVSHFAIVEIARKTGAELTFVHYRGALQQIEAVVEGTLKAGVVIPGVALPFHESGKVRVLATTGFARSSMLKGVPSLRDSGIDVAIREWAGVFAPPRTPPAIVHMHARLVAEALRRDAVKSWFEKIGIEPDSAPPAEFATMVRADYERWGPIVKTSGFKPET
jgi:tripartite-type tricarboxylate transporter receptor subunit TctC